MISDEHPRAKLARRGSKALSDAELIALLLRTVNRLRQVRGVGTVRAAVLTAAAELTRRGLPDSRPLVDCAGAAAGLISSEMRNARKEHFAILCLNSRRQLVHQETVSIGTLSASLVHPREVFIPAIAHASAAIVAVHNHPSGDTTPSTEDRDVTRRLQRGGELLGIPLADHVVVAANGFYSFRENGLL